ncbi:MAG: bifunctional 4-hydroxy-3-methylbut-2-enyl diphosphate reductase/30S ribosomal protein S1 [Defluviitaleaceae bacterium]|nr:bifunctional 4-hydroxy-3-methylbut-2-enyl diphosphate reductase/30S ribosomal protein S1 [Defluviitaleaceae bacterium]
MQIMLAKSAGFCYGVAKALNTVYNSISESKIVTFGPITHNMTMVEDLQRKGVKSVDSLGLVEEGTKVIIRAHGVKPAVYQELSDRGIEFIDATCRDVKEIHNLVEKRHKEHGDKIIIIGDKTHPEVVGTSGYADDNSYIIGSLEEAESFSPEEHYKDYSVVAQTTFNKELFNKIIDIIKSNKRVENLSVFDTICKATAIRQKEAEEISKTVDFMIVLGDKMSSNTTKLFEICKKNCENTFFVESIKDVDLSIFSKDSKIGITAGASTPPEIIKEAVKAMNELDNTRENQSFEEMLNESMVSLHTGDIVKGTVISVSNGEVSVSLGFKSDGIIPRGEFSDNQAEDPADIVKSGDEIEVFVIRVNDSDGNVLLSRKKIEATKAYKDIEAALENKSPIEAKVTDVTKGGLVASVRGVRVFIPSSQVSSRFVADLEQFKGKTLMVNILEITQERRQKRIVAGRRELSMIEENAIKSRVYDSIEVGQKVSGTVVRLAPFGAFVDLGGVDGLIHLSELSWSRVNKASDVLKEGDKVEVAVTLIDREKDKISLSLKAVTNNPWDTVHQRYFVGDEVMGRVVRFAAFGAFVELEQGVDGLIHISQISHKRVSKPDEALTIGEVVKVRIVDVDIENEKISLSKKALDEYVEEYEEYVEEVFEDNMPEENIEE